MMLANRKKGPPRPALAGTLGLCTMLAAAGPSAAAIVDAATAVAVWHATPVISNVSTRSVPVSPGRPSLKLTTTVSSFRQVFPGVYEIEYALGAKNTGTVTLTGIRLADDLGKTLASGRILAGPWLATKGFSGGGPNPSFDGRSDVGMLSGDVRLAPDQSGEVGIRLHATAVPGTLGFAADATASSRQLKQVVKTEPAVLTPGVATDRGLAPLPEKGISALSADKRVVFGPVAEADGWSLVTYRLTASAGAVGVDEVSMEEDLAAGFGAGKYRIVSREVVAAPEGFGATTNPYFDGQTNTDLLTSGGDLGPKQSVAIDLTLEIEAGGNAIANAMTAGGFSAFGSGAVAPAEARATAPAPPREAPPKTAAELQADIAVFRPGERIGYTLTLTNPAATDAKGIDIVAFMPKDFSYLAGTARLDGIAREPAVSGDGLDWSGVTIPAGGRVVAGFDLAAGPASGPGKATASAFGRDAKSGAIVSDIASVSLARDGDAVFDCAAIAGVVFDDRNRDGFRQDGEPGIAGVKLDWGAGGRVTSDRGGNFTVACPLIAHTRIGSELALKLEAASLPRDYRLTTANPKGIRLVRGHVTTADFGAARLRVIELQLDDSSFKPGGTELRPAALQNLARLINRLEEEPSLLAITYHGGAGETGGTLARRRIEAARLLAASAWKAGPRPHGLSIETRIAE